MEMDSKITEILNELNAFYGLESVKKAIGEKAKFLHYIKLRAERGLPVPNGVSHHFVFLDGTDEQFRAVAEIVARLYKEFGLLEKGHVVEVKREELMGERVGETTAKTRKAIEGALGGIFLVTNAEELYGDVSFNHEVADNLHYMMEMHRGEYFMILAGDGEKVKDMLMYHPALLARIGNHVSFSE